MVSSSPASKPDNVPDTPSPSSGLGPSRIARASIAGALSVLATFYGACALALLIYSHVFPWTTGVQIQRWIAGDDTYEQSYEPRPLSELDQDVPLAVVAAEDTRFFEHWGIDWKAINEAIEENSDGDARRRGGSTITQQLVKNLFLTTHSTYLRKALELPLTFLAELLLSKRRILELYVNIIEWGPGIYGIEAAARYHYNQSSARLTRYQAAALAACVPNPRVRRPTFMDRYTRIILQRMRQLESLHWDLESVEHRRHGSLRRPTQPAPVGNLESSTTLR